MSAESVRATLADLKTATRRVIKPKFGVCSDCWKLSTPHNYEQLHDENGELNAAGGLFGEQPYLRVPACDHNDATGGRVRARYRKGERFWIREAWGDVTRAFQGPDCDEPRVIAMKADSAVYNAEGEKLIYLEKMDDSGIVCSKWKSPIHMPRWASRITLEIIDVRIERLQDITTLGIEAEGIRLKPEAWSVGDDTIKSIFGHLWNKINGKCKGCDWESNPFVWRIEFKRIEK